MKRSVLSNLLILSFLLSGCLPEQPLPTATAVPTPTAKTYSFTGRVVDTDGNPIQGASVISQKNNTISDNEGWFKFITDDSRPQWLTVKSDGFISRTRAAAPEVPVLFRLSTDDGKTTVIQFGGDTMFGRRFFDPNEDDHTDDGLLPLDPTVEDHLRLLTPVKPLLENADITVLNLETTMSDQPYFPRYELRPETFHATADYVYASHPNSIIALKQAGVDIVDMGNNHNYDMFEAGLNTSLATLDHVGMIHFGAGTNEANAWAPAVISSKGQTIAFVGCTTVRIPSSSVTKTDVPYVANDALKKGGAAYCTEVDLRAAIRRAKQQADIVIAMIHGGTEYTRTPADKIVLLTQVARQAGATLVINHHPHVVGGFSLENESLVAWTIGNFLFDQIIWQSFEAYMLSVYLREGKVIRAYLEPLIIDGYIPHGLTGELADYVVRGAAGREPGPFIMESGAMEVDLDGRAIQKTYTQTMDGGPNSGEIIHIPESQWISDFKGTGTLVLGRDLLWVGGFENADVDSASLGAPLWDHHLGGVQIGGDYAYEGETGIRLTRGASNTLDVVTTNTHRVLVDPFTNLSVTGMIRINQKTAAQIQFSWYTQSFGPSDVKEIYPIEVQSSNTWESFRFDVQVPKDTVALGVYLRLLPPDQDTIIADFDNIRIIEWAGPEAKYSPLYNYALLTGSGDLTFTQEILPGAEQWINIPSSHSTP